MNQCLMQLGIASAPLGDTSLSLAIGKHVGIKSHFCADDTKFFCALSQKNSSDFDQLMATSKLKLNPDQTELFSLLQIDRLKACFFHVCYPVESFKNVGVLFDSDFLIFPCPNMFKVSAKIVLWNSGALCGSGNVLLIIFPSLWPMFFH